jgi:Carboxypeptidase regulatory-like domain/TonB-dependent Receptor Plug Domain
MALSSRFGSGRRALLAACLALALGAMPAAAQDTGSISGTVVDTSNQVVPGATVTLTNEATADARTTASGPDGTFTFRAVPPGSYTVKIELSGFRTHEQKKNVLNASSRLDLGNLKLEVGTLSEVVSVVAEGATIETKNSDYSGLLTATQISQIQSRGRDVVNLLRLLPGVHYEGDIEAMGDSFGSQIPNIGGMRKHWNQVTVDGLNGNELSGTNRMNSTINLDAIAEVKVLLNTYKAEFGHSGGANIEIVSKSGSSTYQGSGYWYGKRDAWNANAWENNRQGLTKPRLHIDDPGFNIGGPVRIPGLYDPKDNKKLFFFYSFEAPQVDKPGPIRLYRMPTALERQGDFSQTVDANGKLISIKDPSLSGACSVTTGGPGCFPGNVIPANRIDPNALALMKMMPLPNTTSANNSYNFQRQETSSNPRFNNLVRLDGHPSGSNSVWGTFRTWSSSQYGSEITAGPAKWGFFDGSYVSGDNSINGGWNHVFGARGVNELSAGYRRATEGFGTKTDADLQKILKTTVGYNLGQFTNLNTLGVIPTITFGFNTTGTTSPDFTYDSRLGSTAFDYLTNVRDNLTLNRGTHTLKFGGLLEFMENNEARGGTWMGQFQFNNNNNNPLNTNFAFSNMLLGVYQQYSETSRYGDTHNRQLWAEWYGQDTWQINRKMTLDYGLRFLWYTPYWRPDKQIANFDPSKFSAAAVPRLYVPALVNGTRVAVDPATGQTLNQIFIGAYVPGTGNQSNGMVLQTDPGVPRGFRDALAPQPEPRVGYTWDFTGEGKMALHASAGIFHQARLGGGSSGNLRNPPFITSPIIPNNTMANTFVPGVSLLLAPSTVEALETNYKTPASYNWSIGLRRELGWGTSMDATYTGSAGRNLEMYYNLNAVPDGAKFLDLNPQNHDPGSTSATAVLPDNFLRPYIGYGAIRVRGNSGTSDYNALQLQVNRRYIHGVQFGGAYTLQRARGLADEDPGNLSITLNRPRSFYYGELAQSNRHSLVINYTWDISAARFSQHALHYALDGWQLSGENAFVSGDWAPVILTTTDNFDFTGGDGGTGSDLGGGLRSVVPVMTCDPMANTGSALTGFFDTSCFKRPSGRGDYGNAPRNAVRKPGIDNWNLALFKNFAFSGRRSLQYRLEAYNVLNHTQFQDIDRTARFDATGAQVNANFGTAIGISSPTRSPRTLQMSLRFNF